MPHFSRPTSEKSAAAPRGGAAALDRAASMLAARQFGVITYRQLEMCGLSRARVDQRVAGGQLRPLWRGVYSFGHSELRLEGRLLAAVLASGEGALLSHRSAADLWGILPTSRRNVEVTVATRGGRRRRDGLDLHCVRRLSAQDVTELDGIPVTTVARTLVDLCAVVPERKIEKALEQAYVLRLLVPGALEDVLSRSLGRHSAVLRRMLERQRASTLTQSELEERFLALCRRGGLPDPEVNVPLNGYVVDFLWRRQRRVVEVDGHAYHSSRRAQSHDRRKDIDLELAGFPVTRFTHDQVIYEADDTLDRARTLILRQ